jgi:myo-inositol-1(or 4)-monophosphatase
MQNYLETAIEAARQTGELLRSNLSTPLKINVEETHDLKLDLDVRSQELITKIIQTRFPDHTVKGEEGASEKSSKEFEWIVDPIDGTVNFFYGIPHYCISIALQQNDKLVLGVIYDPVKNELWQAIRGEPALLNGQPISVSAHTDLSQSIVSVGFSKTEAGIKAGISIFQKLVSQARKCRMMGSAALDMAYVASGRYDAYIERSVNLWDIAAGIVILESAGGKVVMEPSSIAENKIAVTATNGKLNINV